MKTNEDLTAQISACLGILDCTSRALIADHRSELDRGMGQDLANVIIALEAVRAALYHDRYPVSDVREAADRLHEQIRGLVPTLDAVARRCLDLQASG
jgi:hypothetical protein